MAFIKKTLPLFILFFLLSVAVRLPNIGRPLSKHHEFCTAVSLRVLQIWYEHGARTYHLNPVMTYGNAADRHINNFASGSGLIVDTAGNYYYLSHPPLAYYVPYAFFKVTGIYPTVTAIQYFHLIFHFLSALGMYFIVCVMFGRLLFGGPFFAGIAAFVIYLANPATMWFQCNTYMADMFVQVPYIYGLLAFMLARQSGYKPAYLLPLCAIIFVMVYTSWLGVFFTLAVASYLFFWGIKDSRRWWWAGAIKASMALALGLIMLQYSSIAGFQAYWAEAFQRAGERSVHSLSSIPLAWFIIIKNHIFNYLPLFVAVAILVTMERKRLREILGPHKAYLFVTGSVLALLHTILANYSGHDFVALHAALFWVVVMVLLLQESDRLERYRKPFLGILVLLFMGQYYYINRPGSTSLSGERYDTDRKIGTRIGAQSHADEVVFLLGQKPSPQVVFYAHRNIQQVETVQEAKDFLVKYHQPKGAVFQGTDDGLVELLENIRL